MTWMTQDDAHIQKITWNIDFVPPMPSSIHLLVGNGHHMKITICPEEYFELYLIIPTHACIPTLLCTTYACHAMPCHATIDVIQWNL